MKNTQTPPNRWLVGAVTLIALIAAGVFFFLPPESLVIGLIYRVF